MASSKSSYGGRKNPVRAGDELVREDGEVIDPQWALDDQALAEAQELEVEPLVSIPVTPGANDDILVGGLVVYVGPPPPETPPG